MQFAIAAFLIDIYFIMLYYCANENHSHLDSEAYMKKVILISCAVMLLFALFGCDARRAENNEKPIIAVTILPEKTFVEAVCGEFAEVRVLVPPGFSPENYEPSPQEIEKYNDAALYFSIGVPAEQSILRNVGEKTKVVALHDEVSKTIPERMFEEGERDPHIWLSPKRVKLMIDIICRELVSLDADNAEKYAENAESYKKSLDELDAYIANLFGSLENKRFIVYHPAFGYLAEDYGLSMYALQEEGKDETIRQYADKIGLARQHKLKTVFYQEEVDSRQVEAFAREIGGNSVRLSPLAEDYINNMKAMAQAISEAMQ